MELILYCTAGLSGVLALITLLAVGVGTPRLPRREVVPSDSEELRQARLEAVKRASHFERLLMGIGSVELGILAYVGGMLFGGQSPSLSPNVMFGLITTLFFATTVTYLHTWKMYMAYGVYIVQLEILGLGRECRCYSQVFQLAQEPPGPKWIRPLVAASWSIQAVALFPVVVLVLAIIGSAYAFQVPTGLAVALSGFVVSWTVIYAAPIFVEFLKLVRMACRVTESAGDETTFRPPNVSMPARHPRPDAMSTGH